MSEWMQFYFKYKAMEALVGLGVSVLVSIAGVSWILYTYWKSKRK